MNFFSPDCIKLDKLRIILSDRIEQETERNEQLEAGRKAYNKYKADKHQRYKDAAAADLARV